MDKDITKKLESLELPAIEMSEHQRLLRRAILARYKKNDFMFIFKKAIPIGVALFITVIVAGVVFNFKDAAPASAQDIAEESYRLIERLSPSEKDALKAKLNMGNPEELLKQAQNAKDLASFTFEQLKSQYPEAFPLPSDSKKTSDLSALKFLLFTGADGSKHIIGISSDNKLPMLTVSDK